MSYSVEDRPGEFAALYTFRELLDSNDEESFLRVSQRRGLTKSLARECFALLRSKRLEGLEGPFLGREEHGQQLEEIRDFRQHEYTIAAPYLNDPQQESLESQHHFDKRSGHLLERDEKGIVGTLRFTAPPFEVSFLHLELGEVLLDFPRHIEISRLLIRRDSQGAGVLPRLLLMVGCALFLTTDAQGVIATCRRKLLPMLESFGLVPLIDRDFRLRGRPASDYVVMTGNFEEMIESFLQHMIL